MIQRRQPSSSGPDAGDIACQGPVEKGWNLVKSSTLKSDFKITGQGVNPGRVSKLIKKTCPFGRGAGLRALDSGVLGVGNRS